MLKETQKVEKKVIEILRKMYYLSKFKETYWQKIKVKLVEIVGINMEIMLKFRGNFMENSWNM